MTTFPALIPSSRIYSPGGFPHTTHAAYSGAQVRVRHSNAETGARLRLLFRAITTTELLELIGHYNGQSGGFAAFAIPDELMSGMTTPADFTPSGSQWIYASRPAVVDIPIAGTTNTNRHDVTVELASVPEQPAVYAPRLMLRLSALAPDVTGALPSEVVVPAVAFTLAGLVPDVSAATDPDFASVSLLLSMDGANGSTTFTDSSTNNFTITPAGNAQISTADPKFGTGELLLDGDGDYIQTPANSAFSFGTGDFTVEGWLKPNIVSDNDGVFTFGSGLFLALYLGDWIMGFTGSGGISMGAATAGAKVHFAMTRSGTSTRLFIDGTQKGSTLTDSINLTANQLYIGFYFSSIYGYDGTIDEFRVTKGVARYTANFTPPSAPFPTG